MDNTTLNGNVDISSLDVSNNAIFKGNVTINNSGNKFSVNDGDVSFNDTEITIKDGNLIMDIHSTISYNSRNDISQN